MSMDYQQDFAKNEVHLERVPGGPYRIGTLELYQGHLVQGAYTFNRDFAYRCDP